LKNVTSAPGLDGIPYTLWKYSLSSFKWTKRIFPLS